VFSAIALVGLLGVAGVASAGGSPLATDLSGAEEVPPGDPDGTGFASSRLNSGLEEVCWSITAANSLLPATAAQIHQAPAGETGRSS
jgi:CHRD domain